MNHQPQVVLADTFPAKAHLLITYLTQTNPSVCSFSADGASFYVYDQAEFAQNLPQYFKHNNYGSFVRQLNLYGFNSSRLKDDNDVVEWKHDSFHRDRKDLVNDIKRTKKSKSSSLKPSHVHVDPRASSPGMPSYSDEASTSLADSDVIASPARVLDRKISGTDYEWLAAEFSFLKRQNESLERKLDTLLQITLRINPGMNLEQAEYPGEKRRRRSPVASGGHFTGEEQKVSDTDHLDIEPVPYYDARKMPHNFHHAKASNADSLTAFIDIMLNEDESKSFEQGDDDGVFPESAVNEITRASATSNNANDYDHEDELMEEALTANLPESTLNTDGDLFGLDENEPSLRSSSGRGVVAVTNAAMDKANGPEPIEVISSSVPTYEGLTDIEEANMPIGVHVISARAELVPDDGIFHNRFSDVRHNKRVLCLLVFLIFAVLALTVTLPAVLITQKNKKTALLSKHAERPHSYSQSSEDMPNHYDDGFEYPPDNKVMIEELIEELEELDHANTSTTEDSSISPQPQFSLQSVRYKDLSFSAESDFEYISVTIEGVAYECTNV